MGRKLLELGQMRVKCFGGIWDGQMGGLLRSVSAVGGGKMGNMAPNGGGEGGEKHDGCHDYIAN